MPVPTVYSESGFAAYLTSVLDKLADALDWDAGDPRVIEAVNDTLLEYGASDITTVVDGTGIRRLRALGRRSIWRAVVQATANYYSLSDNGQKLERQQVNEQAREMLKIADAECLEFDPSYAVQVVSVNRPHDPYAVLPDAERVP